MSDPVLALTLRPRIIDALCSVYDPEIPVNIWELGLIYDILIDPDRRVQIRMTLTAPSCPAAQALPVEVERRVREVEGVADASVELVWEPAWSPARMSEAAKLQLGLF
jgi:FeS assembly SUF system protein